MFRSTSFCWMPRPEPDPWGGPKEAPIRKVAQTSKFIRVPKPHRVPSYTVTWSITPWNHRYLHCKPVTSSHRNPHRLGEIPTFANEIHVTGNFLANWKQWPGRKFATIERPNPIITKFFVPGLVNVYTLRHSKNCHLVR